MWTKKKGRSFVCFISELVTYINTWTVIFVQEDLFNIFIRDTTYKNIFHAIYNYDVYVFNF